MGNFLEERKTQKDQLRSYYGNLGEKWFSFFSREGKWRRKRSDKFGKMLGTELTDWICDDNYLSLLFSKDNKTPNFHEPMLTQNKDYMPQSLAAKGDQVSTAWSRRCKFMCHVAVSWNLHQKSAEVCHLPTSFSFLSSLLLGIQTSILGPAR